MTATASDRRDRLRAMLADLKMPGALQRPASILWQPRDLSGLSPAGGHVSMPAPG